MGPSTQPWVTTYWQPPIRSVKCIQIKLLQEFDQGSECSQWHASCRIMSSSIPMSTQSIVTDLSTSLLQQGIAIRMRVSGFSMKPLIQPGSVIRVRPYTGAVGPGQGVARGDVVLMRLESQDHHCLVAHRVIALRDGEVQTKGDACDRADGAQPLSAVIGRVEAVEEPFFLPIGTLILRRIGLWLNAVYPKLVQAKQALVRLWESSY